MLLQLSINQIVLIDALTVPFSEGLNVLTGETGAGKSIVVDAINLVLGDRADRAMIQSGADKAYVEALFDVSGSPEVQGVLADLGLEAEEGLLPIARELTSGGRNLCRVAGVMVPLNTLKRVTSLLVDLHGQHEHQSLLDAKKHLAYLDQFGNSEHQALRANVRALYNEWYETRKALTRAMTDEQERARKTDMLSFQLKELDAAKLRADEETELEQLRDRFRNAERINGALRDAHGALSGDDAESAGLDALRSAMRAIASIAPLGDAYAQLSERLADAVYTVEDIASELSNCLDDMNGDNARAEQVDARLDLIGKLRRKYGASTRDMLAYRERIASELAQMEDNEARIARLEKQFTTQQKALYEQAVALSAARRALAKRFEAEMLGQLKDLGMEKTRFSVEFQTFTSAKDVMRAMQADGYDQAEFLISPNPGEPLKPLARTASGGELSRVMLALKGIAADYAGIPVMIFDEIDTGISGRMAQIVAEKMASIAGGRQVICVTHLPQISAMADAQFVVSKHTDGMKTRTSVVKLDEEGRALELSRMLGGANPESASSIAHARQLLIDAAQLKQQGRAARAQA